jgi:hypothetical protein
MPPKSLNVSHYYYPMIVKNKSKESIRTIRTGKIKIRAASQPGFSGFEYI